MKSSIPTYQRLTWENTGSNQIYNNHQRYPAAEYLCAQSGSVQASIWLECSFGWKPPPFPSAVPNVCHVMAALYQPRAAEKGILSIFLKIKLKKPHQAQQSRTSSYNLETAQTDLTLNCSTQWKIIERNANI